jgi:hypothetical protein
MTKKKIKKQRVRSALSDVCKTKVGVYWHPIPHDRKEKEILSSVDCLFSQEYYSREEAREMLRSL